jgi:hypothetical protein
MRNVITVSRVVNSNLSIVYPICIVTDKINMVCIVIDKTDISNILFSLNY